MDVLPVPVIQVCPSGAVLYLNPPAKALLGAIERIETAFPTLDAAFLTDTLEIGRFSISQEIGEDADEVYEWSFQVRDGLYLATATDVSHRVHSERLIDRHETIAALIETSHSVGTWDHELDKGVSRYSPGFYRILGYEPGEFPPDRPLVLSFIHPDDQERVAAITKDYLTRVTDTFAVEMRMRNKSGAYRWVSVRGAAIFDHNGVATRFTGGFTDIHAQKTAELQRQASERLLNEACSLANLGIWILNPETGMVRVSAELAAIHGYAPEPLFMPLAEVLDSFHPDDRAIGLEAVERLRLVDESCRFALRVQQPSGGLRHLSVLARRSLDEEGKLVLVGVVNDVTEERQRAEAHAIQREFLRSAINSAPSPMFVKDRDGRFVLANEAIASIFGLVPEDIVGRRAQDLIEDQEEVRAMVELDRQILAGEVALPYRYEEKIVTPNGETKWLQTVKQVIQSPDTQESQILVLCTDITALVENQSELEAAREEALASSRLKSEFLANMSHEIRTPMNGVLGMADLLMDTALNEEQRELVNTIRESGNNLMVILNDILDFSKIEAGKMALEIQDVDLVDLVESVAMLFMPRAVEKGLQFGVSVQWGPTWMLRTDPLRLQQVLSNLVGNAIKFTDSGRVEIRLRSEDSGRVRITIADSGAGMNDEAQARIFRSFVQVDGSSTRRHGGTGLGLAISKQLTELLGGTIGLTSTPGMGSSFFVEFPASVLANAVPNRPLAGKKVNLALEHPVKVAALVGPLLRLGAELVIDDEDILVDDPDLKGDEIRFSLPGQSANPSILNEPYCCRRILQVLNRMLHDEPTHVPRLQKGKIGRVLLVEDNAVNRAVASRILQNLNFEVITACNGREAIEAVRGHRFHCILMDLQMPEVDGIEATTKIRQLESKLGHRTPIIALTAHAMSGDRERCFEVGMDDYLTKPIRKEQLSRILEQWVAVTPMDEKQLDLTYLSEIAGDDPEFQREVLEAYLEGLPPMLSELREAAVRSDRKTAYRVIHTLKGSSRSVGANLFAEYCEAAEKRTADEDLAKIAREVSEKSQVVVAECAEYCRNQLAA